MAYYLRAFCTSESRPSIDQLDEVLRRDNSKARLETNDNRMAANWNEAEFYYKEEKQPVIIEVNENENAKSLAAEEIQEFVEIIGNPGLSFAKRRVLNHLSKTRFIISCQLLSDIDDDGYHWTGEILNFYVANFGGMIQADREGFYKGHKIIVDMA